MPLQKTELIILKRTPVRDSSLYLTCLSPEWGKIQLAAKAAIRTTSTIAEALQYFTVSEVVFYQREKKTTDYISKAEVLECFDQITDDEKRFGYASAGLEFVNLFLPEEEANRDIYYLLKKYLRLLNHHQEQDLSAELLHFWYLLCIFVGYSPELAVCVQCGRRVDSESLMVSPELGGVICSDCIGMLETAIKVDLGTIKTLENLARTDIDTEKKVSLSRKQKNQIKDLLVSLTEYHVGRTTDLKSFDFLRKLSLTSMNGGDSG